MKKILLSLIVIMGLIALTSCGIVNKIKGLIEDKIGELDFGDQDGDGDNNNDNGGGSGGGSGGGGGEPKITVTLPEKFYIECNMYEEIDGETVLDYKNTYIKCDDGLSYNLGGLSLLYVFVGDQAVLCAYNEDNERYESYGLTKTKEEAIESSYDYFVGLAQTGDKIANLEKTGTTVYLGKTCEVYKTKSGNLYANESYTLYREVGTNFAMYYEGNVQIGEAHATYKYEVTKYQTSNIELPAHQPLATAITDAYIANYDDQEKCEEVYVNAPYFIKVEYDVPDGLAAITCVCNNPNCQLEALYGNYILMFTQTGEYTITIKGCGQDYTLRVNVTDLPEE